MKLQGKIWQKNITSNINFIKNSIKFNKDFIISKNKKKYAAIIAAGPSLDKDIENLKKYSNFLSIVATDTSFPVLLENQIVPDFVVSIDAQIFSHEHFIINWKKFGNQIREKTVFVLDFCCNSSLTKKLVEQNCNILFFKSGHPLAEKICEQIENQIEKKNCNADNTKFLSLTNGRGTVTSTCFSFCEKMNFENVIFFGADFSFFQNKPYCKSTYLEKNWLSSSSKIESQELQNTKLMYRGKVDKIKNSNIYTTQLLEEYKNEQIRMIEKSDIKNVFCSSENPNNMTLNVLKYDNLSYFQKHDNKYDLKYDNKSLLKYDIKYDINYDILPNFVFLPLKAWQKAKNIESNKT